MSKSVKKTDIKINLKNKIITSKGVLSNEVSGSNDIFTVSKNGVLRIKK
jgi:hypothetical protein